MKNFKRLFCYLLFLCSIFQITGFAAKDSIKVPSHTQVAAVKKLMIDNPEKFDVKKKSGKQLFPMECLGLEVDKTQGIYYSKLDAWEKEFGYDDLYDKIVPLLNKEKIEFKYDDKTWVIWLWKGYYIPVLGYGAEIGTYIKDPFEKFPMPKKIEYRGVNDDEMLTVSYRLKRADKELFSFAPQKHWWLAGFKPCDYIPAHELKMEATIVFLTEQMAEAFEKAVKDHSYDLNDLKRENNIINFSWK